MKKIEKKVIEKEITILYCDDCGRKIDGHYNSCSSVDCSKIYCPDCINDNMMEYMDFKYVCEDHIKEYVKERISYHHRKIKEIQEWYMYKKGDD